MRALGPQEREAARQLYKQLVELLTAEAVFLPLAYPDYVFAADGRLAGLEGEAGARGGPVCDSWYEFTKFAHRWRWREEN